MSIKTGPRLGGLEGGLENAEERLPGRANVRCEWLGPLNNLLSVTLNQRLSVFGRMFELGSQDG